MEYKIEKKYKKIILPLIKFIYLKKLFRYYFFTVVYIEC